MAKTKKGPNPNARTCGECGLELPSKFALKAHRWTCTKVKS